MCDNRCMVSTTVRDTTDLVAARLLRQLRSDLHLTQAQVADMAGLPRSVVGEYETGRRQPSLGALIRVVEACGKELRLRLDDRDRHDELLAEVVPEKTRIAFAAEQAALRSAARIDRNAERYLAETAGAGGA